MVALVAPSGTGKSTLLHTAGLLERPDAGDVILGRPRLRPPVRRRAHGDPPQRHRLRLPVPSSAAGVLGAGKHHDAAADQGAGAQRRPRERARSSCSTTCRSASAAQHRPVGAFRRRAAARRHCPRRGQRAAGAAGRRADRQSRSRSPRPMCSRRSRRWCGSPGLAALIATHNHELAARMDRRVTLADGKVVPL